MHDFQSQLNDALVARGNAVEYPNILAVDFHGTLKPAAAATNREDASWENEIHPTSDGYATLAEKFGSEVVSRLRRARIA
jgi:lysophospholipase L1-like esterase